MKNEATKMIKTPQSLIRVAVFCLPLALVASCGGEQGAQPGSTITVSPQEKLWTIGSSPCDGSVLQDDFFNIAVKSPNGIPLTGIDIRVSLNLSPGTVIVPPPPPTLTLMFLYDDLDGDGFYTDPITTFPHYTNTGSAGTKTLRVQYDLSCTYGGDLDVYSGSSHGFAHIEVELQV